MVGECSTDAVSDTGAGVGHRLPDDLTDSSSSHSISTSHHSHIDDRDDYYYLDHLDDLDLDFTFTHRRD